MRFINIPKNRKQSDIDWVSAWFPLMEQNGEYVEIVYGRVRPSTGECKLYYLPHTEFDGLGGFAHILRQKGCAIQEIPTRSKLKRPHILRYSAAICRYLHDSGIRQVQWKNRNAETNGRQLVPCWYSFSDRDSLEIEKKARVQKASVNSLLLYVLNQVVDRELISETETNWWLIPVNMRGGVCKEPDTANHASYITAKIQPGHCVREVHRGMQKMFSQYYDWGAWWGINIGRWIGNKGMGKVLQMYHQQGHSWVGSFSNLGSWPPGHANVPGRAKTPEDEAWFFCPPVTRAHPIGAGCLQWRDRITLALQIHPSITEDTEVTSSVLHGWKDALLF